MSSIHRLWKVDTCLLYQFVGTDTVELKDKVTRWSLSLDMDRVPFVSLTLTLAGVTPDWEWPRMDPRDPNWLIGFRAKEYDEALVETGNVLRAYPVRILRVTRDYETETITMECSSFETALQERIRLAGTELTTTWANLETRFFGAMSDMQVEYPMIPASYSSSLAPGSWSIPAGDRRLMMPGESWWAFLDREFNAAGWRLRGSQTGGWLIDTADTVTRPFGIPSTLQLHHLDEADAGLLGPGTIIRATETLDRTGNYADGVLIRYDWMVGTTRKTDWAASGSGAHAKGIQYNVSGPKPAGTPADNIAARAERRGRDVDVVAFLDPLAFPGQTLYLGLAGYSVETQLRAVTFDMPEGTMTLKGQTAGVGYS